MVIDCFLALTLEAMQAVPTRKTVLVCVVGGVTPLEISALRFLSEKSACFFVVVCEGDAYILVSPLLPCSPAPLQLPLISLPARLN